MVQTVPECTERSFTQLFPCPRCGRLYPKYKKHTQILLTHTYTPREEKITDQAIYTECGKHWREQEGDREGRGRVCFKQTSQEGLTEKGTFGQTRERRR